MADGMFDLMVTEMYVDLKFAYGKSINHKDFVIGRALESYIRHSAANKARIVVVTPHYADLDLSQQRLELEQYAPLRGMRLTSVEGFQGQEADIVVVIMGTFSVHPNHGLGFTFNKRLVNLCSLDSAVV